MKIEVQSNKIRFTTRYALLKAKDTNFPFIMRKDGLVMTTLDPDHWDKLPDRILVKFEVVKKSDDLDYLRREAQVIIGLK